MSVNKAILIGYVGKDPEVKQVGSSTVAKFSLATSESYTDKNGQKQEKTEWHNIVAWGKLAEFCGKWITKGQCVFVTGRINTRSYGDEGNKKYTTEITAEEIKFVGNKRSATENGAPQDTGHAAPPPIAEDELPF